MSEEREIHKLRQTLALKYQNVKNTINAIKKMCDGNQLNGIKLKNLKRQHEGLESNVDNLMELEFTPEMNNEYMKMQDKIDEIQH